MNPLIKKTVEKISNHVQLSEGEKSCIAVEIGHAIMEALIASQENPNFNMNGDGHINENTIGNFQVGNHLKPIYVDKLSKGRF